MEAADQERKASKGSTPRLDLFNFDSPESHGSRYILTSPRSLKACSRLGIKPVDLLPKSLHDFSVSVPDSLRDGCHSEEILRSVYQEWEKQRRGKLQAARKERERVIAELKGGGPSSQSGCGQQESASSRGDVKFTTAPKSITIDETGLKDKDHRILDALESRFAGEERASLLQSAVRLHWDIQRKREQLDKQQRELQQKRELERSQQLYRQQLSQLKSLRDSVENEEKLHLLSSLETKWDRFHTSAELQAKARSQRMEEKRRQEDKKKQLQEQRLTELECDRREALEAEGRYWREMSHRAVENRSLRAHNESMERQLKRDAALSRHKANMTELSDELRAQEDALKSYLQERDSLVQQRYLTQKAHRDATIRQASESQSERAQKAKQVTEGLKCELEEWQKELDVRHQQSMTQAEQASQRLLEERRQRAHSARVKKEREHHDRMELLSAGERERKLLYAEEIESKNERSESIWRERQDSLEKSRQAAHTSATLRQKVKDKYLRNSFDRMALEAELLASLERRHTQTTHTKSKTILG